MKIEKRGFRMPMSWEYIKVVPTVAGHWEPYNMTSEEVKERSRAKKLLKELERNPWIEWDISGPVLRDRKTRVWVRDE